MKIPLIAAPPYRTNVQPKILQKGKGADKVEDL
jgi:hypothetical protein